MDSEKKKVLLLLKLVIFNYHGLDEEEKMILDATALELNAQVELKWAYDFIEQDFLTSFERAREYLKATTLEYDKATKLDYMRMVWVDANSKGYVSEIEAMSMLKLAKDWGVQRDLLVLVRN